MLWTGHGRTRDLLRGGKAGERKKIGRQRDEKIVPVRENMTALCRDVDLGDFTLTDEDKERVREFMSGDVAPHHEAGAESVEQREPEQAANSEE